MLTFQGKCCTTHQTCKFKQETLHTLGFHLSQQAKIINILKLPGKPFYMLHESLLFQKESCLQLLSLQDLKKQQTGTLRNCQ